MKKRIFIVFLVLAATLLVAVGNAESTALQLDTSDMTTLSVVTATGMPAVSMSYLIAEDPQVYPGINLEYQVVASLDLLSARILSGEADIVVATTDLGARLHARGVDLRYVGSGVWGMLHVATTEELNSWEDLRDRVITTLGRGLAPGILLRYLLASNGLAPDVDVTLEYVQATTELAPRFITGASTISVMPEPALSMVLSQRDDASIMLDLQQEWAAVSGLSDSYPQGSLFVRGEVADAYPEFVAALAERYGASIALVNADPTAAGIQAATFLDTPPAAIIARSIPRANLRWVSAVDARASVEEYLGVLLEFDPGAVGGSLPDEAFYFEEP